MTDPDWFWQFRAAPVRVVDGDTIRCDVDLGFYLRNTVQVRLLGIDTPEVRGETREAGLAAKNYVTLWLNAAAAADYAWPLIIETSRADSFDRWLARVVRQSDGHCLNDDLLANGYAVVWERRSG